MMNKYGFQFIGLISLILLMSGSLAAQSWNLVKEKNGVQIYTRKEDGKTLKSYKGTAVIKAPAARIFSMIEDVNHTDWWDKNINQIKVLHYEKNKRAKYYLLYDLPWPVTDRDLYVDVTASFDTLTGVYKVTAKPLGVTGTEKHGIIRIKEYWQTWTIKSAGKELSLVTLEGHVDPAGSIPDWISNMVIVDSPMKIINDVKQRMEKK